MYWNLLTARRPHLLITTIDKFKNWDGWGLSERLGLDPLAYSCPEEDRARTTWHTGHSTVFTSELRGDAQPSPQRVSGMRARRPTCTRYSVQLLVSTRAQSGHSHDSNFSNPSTVKRR